MAEKQVRVNLSEITINKENFRHEPVTDEREAIKYLMDEDKKGYLTLAGSMFRDLRTIVVLILEREGKYELMDANRRISVIKLSQDHSLIPEGDAYNDIRGFFVGHPALNCNEVIADIYHSDSTTDTQNLFDALNELHLRDDPTKKPWNALAQYRASKHINAKIKHPWMKTLLYYYSDNEKYIIDVTNKNADIFSRLLRTKELKIDSDGQICLPDGKKILDEIISAVKSKKYILNGEEITVNTRIKSEDTKNILQDIISSSKAKDNHDIKEEEIEDKGTPSTHEFTENRHKKRERSKAKKEPSKFEIQKLDIAKDLKISDEYHIAISNILKEIKKLGKNNAYESYKLATYYLIRALIEQCLKYWLSSHFPGIYKNSKNGNDANLSKMIANINKAISDNTSIFNPEINNCFRIFFESPVTIKYLNDMIHHTYLLPEDISVLHNYTTGYLYKVLDYILTSQPPERTGQ